MPVLEDIGWFLQTNGFGSLGTSIFLGTIPQDPPGGGQDAVLGLFETPGPGARKTHDLLGPSVEQPVIQLRFRGSPFGYAAARQQAGAAFRLLDGIVNQTINNVFYQQIIALQSPFSQPADEWNRPFIIFQILCARDGLAP